LKKFLLIPEEKLKELVTEDNDRDILLDAIERERPKGNPNLNYLKPPKLHK